MSDQIPEVSVVGARRSIWDRVSVVWLVPVAAFLISVGVAWQSYSDRGPLITIYFDNTAGIAEGETELRYRDVAVGIVETVGFTEDLSQVALGVRVEKEVGSFIDEDAEFWIVRPEVTTQGVSGLDTVLSGVYLEGQWDEVTGEPTFEFLGLEVPPLLQGSAQGLEILLQSTSGALAGNTPILYKGVEVGVIGLAEVSADGVSVEAPAVIYSPYDNLVTEVTRFWDTSGFSLTLGATGAAVDFESIASLIAGGVTFDTFVAGAPLAEPGAVFSVFDGEDDARESIFEPEDTEVVLFTALFDGNVAGLTPGAAVELNGLRIGQVRSVNGIVTETPSGNSGVQLLAVISVQPSRIGLEGDQAPERTIDFFQQQVRSGLRARLVTASILTGGLKVEFIAELNPVAAEIDMTFDPHPLVPTTSSEIANVQASAQDTLQRINDLPIEELLAGATSFLNSASGLIGSAQTQQLPAEINALLAEVRGVVGSESVQDLPRQIGQIMTEIEATVGDVRSILASVEEQEIVGNVGLALAAVAEITEDAQIALEGVPGLMAQLEIVAGNAAELPLADLLEDVAELAGSANAILSDGATQALPGRVDLLMQDMQVVAADAARLTGSLDDAAAAERIIEAIDMAGATLAAIDVAVEGVPSLLSEVERLATRAADLPLEDLVAEVTGLSNAARSVVADPATQALPAQVGEIAEELRGTLAEVRTISASLVAENASARLLKALETAEASLATVNAAFDGVPELIDDIGAVVDTMAALPLNTLVEEVTEVSEGLSDLVASDATQALPAQVAEAAASLTRTLDEVAILAAELNAANVGAELAATIEAAASALATVDASVAGLPQLIEDISAVAANAEGMDLAQLSERANAILASAETLIASEGTQALPEELNAAIIEIRRLLEEFREGGAVGNLNAALISARSATDEIAAAAEQIPALLNRANGLLAQADATLAGFEDTSPAIRDARAALADISRAAEAVASLARAIERRPNSLLTGR